MEKIIAYCGINCADCGAFLALKNNDQALREKTAAEWSTAHNFSFTPGMINCTSCKGGGVQVGYCSQCEIRICGSKKGVENCGACDDFRTCATIDDFLAQAPLAKDNLAQQ